MEDFMSGLLARAAGKAIKTESLFPITSDHVGGMIADEPIRREYPPSSDENMSSDSSFTSVEDYVTDASDTDSFTNTDYPSYVSLYGTSGYSSSPTYSRGDFYSLTPPTSPNLGSNSKTSPHNLSFSIESILGHDVSDTPESNVCNDAPAQIFTSAYSTEDDVVHQLKDASSCSFEVQGQISSGQDSVSSNTFMYWCHVCEDFCENHEDACMHQNNHFTNTEHCRLRRAIFQQSGYVSTHEKTGYWNKLKCGLCEKIVTYRFFKSHLKCHEGHVCKICSQEFPSPCRLRDHINSHYGYKPHVCKVCCEQFSDRRDLNVHSRKHKPCIHQCNFCSKRFRTRHAQTVHMRTHTGSSPFVCLIPGCWKSFSQSLHLQLHLKAHKNHDGFL